MRQPISSLVGLAGLLSLERIIDSFFRGKRLKTRQESPIECAAQDRPATATNFLSSSSSFFPRERRIRIPQTDLDDDDGGDKEIKSLLYFTLYI